MSKEKSVELNYESAYAELQRILQELQEETVSIDELAAKVARAKDLILFCRERLRQTEEELSGLGG
ncbi:MAG: exodeoxyribonuclease VII small subunit [Saprospiraceae bacterium]